MGEPARTQIFIPDFPGLLTNEDPDDIQHGSSRLQTNVTSAVQGYLIVRGGMRQVNFEEA